MTVKERKWKKMKRESEGKRENEKLVVLEIIMIMMEGIK